MAKNENWDLEIKTLEEFFSKQKDLPPMEMSVGRVLNGRKFVENSLLQVKRHNGNDYFRPTLDDLLEYKDRIEQNSEPFINF